MHNQDTVGQRIGHSGSIFFAPPVTDLETRRMRLRQIRIDLIADILTIRMKAGEWVTGRDFDYLYDMESLEDLHLEVVITQDRIYKLNNPISYGKL